MFSPTVSIYLLLEQYLDRSKAFYDTNDKEWWTTVIENNQQMLVPLSDTVDWIWF